MGSDGPSISLPTLSDVGRSVENLGRSGNLGNSLDYMNPFTIAPRMTEDYYGSQTKQDQAEKEAKRMQRLAEQSRYRQEQIQNAQAQISQHFTANKAKYTGLLQDAATKPLRADMSRKLYDNKQSASRRGLIGSGIEQRGAADILNRYKNDFGVAYDQGTRDFEDIYADALEAPAITGLGMSGSDRLQQEDFFKSALQERQNRNELARGLGGAAGTVAGSYYASKKYPTTG